MTECDVSHWWRMHRVTTDQWCSEVCSCCKTSMGLWCATGVAHRFHIGLQREGTSIGGRG